MCSSDLGINCKVTLTLFSLVRTNSLFFSKISFNFCSDDDGFSLFEPGFDSGQSHPLLHRTRSILAFFERNPSLRTFRLWRPSPGIHTTRNVGIGTTTATEKLTVDGNISLPDNKSIFIGDDSDLEIYHGAR